ncbi:Acetyl-hydrolase [Desulfosarcina cetonica]|uniref:alpha/beta hydrolase n=1 Tax=Desulfosarcina cetonica TaxID=90730 RepID=UPI0012EDC062|nr:alpha/beta hydrolase [Desulfosarcina cetonica]VTR70736.1 Acetyl-hydrolase [Desulfosarcina cetonica]
MPSLRATLCRLITKYGISPKLNKIDSIDETRKKMEKIAKFAKLPPGTQVEKITIDGMAAEWIAANTVREDIVILYLHGGGYNVCSPNTHREFAAHISKASGAKVLLIDYRLAPEHPFPAALQDATAAYRWLLNQGLKGKRIAIAGDSAGGGLTLTTAISIRDAGIPLPSSIACISPWTDLMFTGNSIKTNSKIDPLVTARGGKIMAENYIGDHDPRNPLISPLYAEMSGLPPILIHVGTDEMLLDDSKRIAKKAEDAGVNVTLKIYDKLWHVFHLNVNAMPEAKTAVAEFGAFIAEHFE